MPSKGTSFNNTLVKALVKTGFERTSKGAAVAGKDARVVLCIETSKLTSHTHVSFGIWIFEISTEPPPDAHNQCHVCGSLSAIAPALRDALNTLSPNNERAQAELISAATEIHERALALTAAPGLRAAHREGEFAQCLVRKEARSFLVS